MNMFGISTVSRRGLLRAAAMVFLLAASSDVAAQTIETSARHAILLDVKTGTVLLERDADTPMPPASMSKLMTVLMVFERLKNGALNLDDKFLVSEQAWRKGGSKMFVKVNTRVSVEDLLRGIIVQSGNDACIVIAEGISGSEVAFAEAMTRRGREIGLTNSTFRNSTGWPDEGHLMSSRDVATLSALIIREYPEFYTYFSELSFSYNGIKQGNRNPLLYNGGFGADGLKTGHTEASGYGLAASVKRNDRRLILVINGLDSVRARSSESARLVDWGFRETGTYALFKRGDMVSQADVWLGKAASVPLVIERDLDITISRRARREMKVKVVFTSPLPAPLKLGTEVGRLVVTVPGHPDIDVPVSAGAEVARLGMFGRLVTAVRYLLLGGAG